MENHKNKFDNFLDNFKDFFLGWMSGSGFSFGLFIVAVASLFVWCLMIVFNQTVANTIIIGLFSVMMLLICRYLWKHRGNR